MSTVDEDIVALREAVGARSDAHLADLLGYSRSNVNAWRKRGGIPKAALAKGQALARSAQAARRFEQRSAKFDTETMGKGRCLAIFLAPSCDVLVTRRFPATLDYGALLDSYAASFNFISLACAEEVAERASRDGSDPATALGSLTQEDERKLYDRIMERVDRLRGCLG